MTQNICKCGKGYESQWDLKCGHCRTKKETEELQRMQANSSVPPGHIRIVYVGTHQPTEHDVVVGTGSVLANPFGWLGGVSADHIMKDEAEAKASYSTYLYRMVTKDRPNEIMQAMEQIVMKALSGEPVKLVCNRKDCHAEIIKNMADQIVRQQLLV